MAARTRFLTILILCATGCNVVIPGGTKARSTPKPSAISPAKGSSAPEVRQAIPSLVPPSARGLVAPVGAVSLSGTLEVEAAYLSKAHNATLIANNGSNVLVASGAQLISDRGGSALGGQITDAGGQVLSNAGASLIVDEGKSGLAGNGFLGQDGGALGMAAAPRARRVLADSAPLSPGLLLRAAGAWVSVLDMHTAMPVSLGVDEAGRPVYTVATEPDGSFKVYLPAGLAGSVRVVARLPGVQDRRAVYQTITDPNGATLRVNPNSAVLASYLREVVAGQIMEGLNPNRHPAANLPPEIALINVVFEEIVLATRAIGAPQAPYSRQYELALMIADRAIANLDTSTLPVDPGLLRSTSTTLNPTDSAAEVTLDIVGKLDRAAAQRMATESPGADGQYFVGWPYLVEANNGRAPEDQFAVYRPGDVVDFLVRRYLGTTDIRLFRSALPAFVSLGLQAEDLERARQGGLGLSLGVMRNVLFGTEVIDGKTVTVKDEIIALIAARGPAILGARSSVAASPTPGPAVGTSPLPSSLPSVTPSTAPSAAPAEWPVPVPTSVPPAAPGAQGVVLPNGTWEGPVALGDRLTVQARLEWPNTAGANLAMRVSVDGRGVPPILLNKAKAYTYEGGFVEDYFDPIDSRWRTFYSPNFVDNDTPGNSRAIVSDPGQTYLYVWRLPAAAASGTRTLKIENAAPSASLVFSAW